MGNIKDLTGMKFNKLTVISLGKNPSPNNRRGSFWECVCECGNTITVRSDTLQCGNTSSCGCVKIHQDKINLTKHFRHMEAHTRLYNEWISLRDRCNNTKNSRYSNWGGRGIFVCDKWNLLYESFRDWALSNGYEKTLTIDRIDNNGGYEPGNCRWVDNKTQCRNRRSNRYVIDDKTGEKMIMLDYCNKYDLKYVNFIAKYSRRTKGHLLNSEMLFKTISQCRDNHIE